MNDTLQPQANPFEARARNAQNALEAPEPVPEPLSAPITLPQAKNAPEPILVSSEGTLELRSVEQVFRLGKLLWLSKLLPSAFRSPEQICVALLRALELKLPPLQALEGMSVINGRVGLGGDLALSLVEASGQLKSKSVSYQGEGDSLVCTVTLQRKGREAQAYCFSVAEARQAGIYDRSQPWKAYPKRMTYYRALGFGLRDEFSDILKGIVTVDELKDYPPEAEETTRDGMGK